MQLDGVERGRAALAEVLASVHGQLQFAEAKNGALLAVNLALVGGVGAILASNDIGYEFVRLWLFVGSFGLAGAAFVALTSFLPITGLRRHDFAKGGSEPGGNLYYWQTIADYTPDQYAATFLHELGVAEPPCRLHHDLANQIVINAGIAGRKFRRFELAAWITLFTTVLSLFILGGLFVGNGWQLR